MTFRVFIIFMFLICGLNALVWADDQSAAQPVEPAVDVRNSTQMREEEALLLYDDRKLLDAYVQKYQTIEKETLLQMLDDGSLSSYQLAAAVRVFRQNFLNDVPAIDKKRAEHSFLRCLNRSASAFVQLEAMDTLIILDRYKYFQSIIPLMIQKLEHYNDTVNQLAFDYLNEIIAQQPERSREAQIVFNTIKKILFLSRNNLVGVKEPNPRLAQKLKILRWSIKVLGTDDLDKLPKEVIGLL